MKLRGALDMTLAQVSHSFFVSIPPFLSRVGFVRLGLRSFKVFKADGVVGIESGRREGIRLRGLLDGCTSTV